MNWYEYFNLRTRERIWWTQRDKNGVCFEIRNPQGSNKLVLFRCDERKAEYKTLQEAQKAAHMMMVD